MPTGVYLRTKKHSFNLGKKHPNRKKYFKGKSIYYKECNYCKKDFIVDYKNHIRNRHCSLSCSQKSFIHIGMRGMKQSEKQRQMMKNRKGSLHPRWISDRKLLKDDSKLRGGQLHREWSRSVKLRDTMRCKINTIDCCGRLESHHILSWAKYPELRYEIKNGITLCRYHHPRKRIAEEKLINYFQELLTTI